MNTRQILRSIFLLVVAGVLAACASVGPRTMTFSEADIARLLEQHGPFQRRLLEVLDVRVQRPSVKLLTGSNRLASAFEVSATERVSRTTLNGRIAVEYGLRYDEGAQAIRMTQVRVNELVLNDVSPAKQAGLKNLGTLIAENLLEDTVLYRFKPSDLKNAEGRGFKPGAVNVTSRGVEVTLTPL
ncbi:hypothetical protein [Piscinibacter sp. XHJ-5]|uniref:hypothetical protein n=1 Tax=Piscinibacter sp. XHJ-5 TaxID=3037797 RepID=UPI002452FD33|nr:hypothetical protein [Piscinibacter sp. XHJ-5]